MRLGGEQLSEESEYVCTGVFIDLPQPFDQPALIYGPDLIQDDLAGLPFKVNRQASGVGAALRRHWGDDDGVDVLVHLVRGNDEAGACFTDFAAFGWV